MEKTETREAVARLRNTIGLMQKREAFLEAKAKAEAQNARQNFQRDKRTALAALKRRRHYQALRPICFQNPAT
jgi:charged multivesicular body protein 4